MIGSMRDDCIAALATMSPVQLRVEWRRVWRTAPPDMTPDLLARGIAWKLQAQVHGGLSVEAKRKLKRLLNGGDTIADALVDKRPKPGTRIIREWNGRTLHVLVTDEGYVFEDQRYGSLSEIARQVTGTNWSGPRFFGLKAKRSARDAA